MKSLNDGNGCQTECGWCGRKLYIWDGLNESAISVASHYTLYCSKQCYDDAKEDDE